MPGGWSTTDRTAEVIVRMSRAAAYDRSVLKEVAKRMMQPLIRRVGARVDARIQPVRRGLADVSDRIEPLQAEVEGLNKHLGPIVARVQTHDRLTRSHEEAIVK